jgi:hypothetical protein
MKARLKESMYMKDWVAELDKFTGLYGKDFGEPLFMNEL